MLDGILGRGFSSKCKSLIKLTRTRIDVIQRKRGATEKFLKKDIADLLSNGLDINAYERAEGLLLELTLSFCYLYIELCCAYLLKQLSLMQKSGECPENCREAVSSLMYAAARFSDLPELRDLRQAFQERYGNSLDHFVNQEFSERMAAKPSTMEKKIKLMMDIASEYSISWDAKEFEKRMARPPSTLQGSPRYYGSHPVCRNDEKRDNKSIQEKKSPEVSLKQRLGESDDQNFHSNKEHESFRRCNGILDRHQKAELSGNRHGVVNEQSASIFRKIENSSAKPKEIPVHTCDKSWWEENPSETDRSGTSRAGKSRDGGDGRLKERTGWEKYHSERGSKGNVSPYGEGTSDPAGLFLNREVNSTIHPGAAELGAAQTLGRAIGEEAKRPQYKNGFPPPYVKPSGKPIKERECEDIGNLTPRNNANGHLKITSIPKSPHFGQIQAVSDNTVDGKRDGNPEKVTALGNGEGFRFEDDAAGHFLPRPKSIRKRCSKPRPIFDESSHEDAESGRRTSRSSRRREESRKGLQVLFNDERVENDEEERIIDGLLMHYSKKSSSYEPGQLRRKGRGHRELAIEGNSSKPDDEDDMEVPQPPRSLSLPHQQATEAATPAKKFNRAASFEPARHVHPKLPEYDDLAARLASLRGS
ncbi:hypothetical protein MLD38_006611 [Melastoma candidum]|uniref:Uncharacterized protein n=1 Tax=Melastoma candidum TaxID=119954 RepID=A0ACB9RMP1_9MYRT|nr:hypothetical protein MLD38_006611 [Melastoma candidum]